MVQAVVVRDFTVDLARDLLALNGPGRSPDPQIVRCYVDQMRADQWCVDGNTFKINQTGHLIDGQHRLHAAIEAGYTFEEVIIVTGIPDKAAWAMDPPGQSRGR